MYISLLGLPLLCPTDFAFIIFLFQEIYNLILDVFPFGPIFILQCIVKFSKVSALSVVSITVLYPAFFLCGQTEWDGKWGSWQTGHRLALGISILGSGSQKSTHSFSDMVGGMAYVQAGEL